MRRIIVICMILLFVPSLSYAQAASYAVIDAKTQRLLEGEQPYAQLPIASLTKIWTALIVLENADLQQQVTISRQATMQEGSSIYLQEGELVTIEKLLHGLLLRSGNDAAFALAEAVGGSEQGFVKLMNDRAVLAGLSNTHFTNVSGLHHAQHYSSAYDTAKMLAIAMENKKFAQIASTKKYEGWQNKHRLLHEDIGALAGKTGYTKVAGRTLATFFKIDKKQFIVVTLNSSNDWVFHRTMAEKIDATYEMVTVAPKGTYKLADLKVKLKDPIKLLLNDKESTQIRHMWQQKRGDNESIIWHVYLQNERIFNKRIQ